MKKLGIILLFFGMALIMLWYKLIPHEYRERMIREETIESEAMAALNFWSAQRAYPEEAIPDQKYYKAFEYVTTQMKKEAESLKPLDTWESIGPRNRGGRTIALAIAFAV